MANIADQVANDIAEDEAQQEPVGASNNSQNASANNAMNPQDLLPGANTLFGEVNPSGVGDLVGKNLLNAGFHIGVNTQGCSLRNANRGLRSEPPNPQVQVSPWLQTTICPDLHRKSLDC